VQAPYLTYSSATDGPAGFGQSGTRFAVEGAGADLWTDADAYSTIYRPSAVSAGSTVQTEVTAQSGMSGYAKAGIIVRNAMTAAGTGTEGVILYESPSGGIQLEWNSNGDTTIDSVTPANGTIADTVPVYLRLAVAGDGVYTGYYSTDGSTWTEVGTATVPGQNATQDAGLFMLSHSTGSSAPAEAAARLRKPAPAYSGPKVRRFRSTLTGTVVQRSPARNPASRPLPGFGGDVSGSFPSGRLRVSGRRNPPARGGRRGYTGPHAPHRLPPASAAPRLTGRARNSS
jgi:hypothetical protein